MDNAARSCAAACVWPNRLVGWMRGRRRPRLWLVYSSDVGWRQQSRGRRAVERAVALLRPELDWCVEALATRLPVQPTALAPPEARPLAGFATRDFQSRIALAGRGLTAGDVVARLLIDARGRLQVGVEPVARGTAAGWLEGTLPTALPLAAAPGNSADAALAALIAAQHVQQTDGSW